MLRELRSGFWNDPRSTVRPDRRQISDYHKLRALLEELASTGYIENEGSYNSLHDGMWELKLNNIRLTFYDTSGDGYYEPKLGETRWDWSQKRRQHLPEDFDEQIRVGHGFAKTGQKAPEAEVKRAKALREEDVNHDRN